MTQRNRDYLSQEFQDGERPSGQDFADVFDSFINLVDDGLSVDAAGNLLLSQGLVLGDSAIAQAGALRFHSGQVEFHNGSEWAGLAAGGESIFEPVGAAGAVVYSGGNVGIGNFGATGPAYRLEVNFDGGPEESRRVRFGPAVIFGTGNGASFAHNGLSNLNTDFGFRQEQTGRVQINAPTGQTIRFDQGGNTPRLAISSGGNVIVGLDRNIPGRTELFQVNGTAFKNQGGDMWATTSDLRVKEQIQDLNLGLDTILQIRPVRFCFNGEAGTPQGEPGIGIIGQEIETVLPDTIHHVFTESGLGSDDPLRIYNGSALTYVLINAVKELATKVQQLEADLAQVRQAGAQP